MKHYFYIIFALISSLSIISCGNSDGDKELDTWKAANEQAFKAITANREYKELKSPGNEGSLYYKVLQEGTGTKPIYYNSVVKIYSKGWYVESYKSKKITAQDVFQRWLFDNGEPYITEISTSTYLATGIKVALQNMHQGDKWEIWLPYQLASGSQQVTVPYSLGLESSSPSVTVPAYSTLVFEIEVVDVP